MHEHLPERPIVFVGRRSALQRVLAAAGGGALALCAPRLFAADTPPPKLAKDAVKYTDHGAVAGKDCDDCSQYIAPASASASAFCKIVDGPISPHGHCIAFSPKPKG
jgi:hypothetical protein